MNKIISFFILLLLENITAGYSMEAKIENQLQEENKTLITHQPKNTFDLELSQQRLQKHSNLTYPLSETLDLLKEMTEFELGNFLLENKGLNGYWTAYIILHGPQKKLPHPLEDWIIHKAPTVRATQERFKIFQHQLQKRCNSNMKLASIPCGLMDDLFSLDYQNKENLELIGIDLDPESLELAKKNAKNYKTNFKIEFFQKNAWNLGVNEEYGLITSNGLNIYEPEDEKVIELYKSFNKALQPNGILIISFLTPPTSWENYDLQDVKKQKALFGEIVEAKWQVFRTESQTREHLQTADFKILDIIYDSQKMFPTVIAKKL